MTLSMMNVVNTLRQKGGDISLYELGFILTVIRDNAADDEVFDFLDKMVKELDKKIS